MPSLFFPRLSSRGQQKLPTHHNAGNVTLTWRFPTAHRSSIRTFLPDCPRGLFVNWRTREAKPSVRKNRVGCSRVLISPRVRENCPSARDGELPSGGGISLGVCVVSRRLLTMWALYPITKNRWYPLTCEYHRRDGGPVSSGAALYSELPPHPTGATNREPTWPDGADHTILVTGAYLWLQVLLPFRTSGLP